MENKGKTFELLDRKTGNVLKELHNEQPRGAALKAAGYGVKDIILRERGTENEKMAAKLHLFTGSVVPDKWKLPLPDWKIQSEATRTGKAIPPELNVKGKEAELEKAGFELPPRDKPVVKKVKIYHVPKIKGADIHTSVSEFLKTLPEVA